jgi:hypothetical protein
MSKKYWGPHLWESLNIITREYPHTPSSIEKQNYKLFFQSFGDVIPCKECRMNYRKHLNKFSLDSALESRDTLAEFLVNIHNEVNEMKGKPLMPMERGKQIVLGDAPCPNYNFIALTVVLSSIIVYLIMTRCR